MNPQCAKCLKTVYPVEKLNCLDKVRSGLKDEIWESKHANLSHKKYNNEEENQSIKILNREQEFLHFRSSFFGVRAVKKVSFKHMLKSKILASWLLINMDVCHAYMYSYSEYNQCLHI